MTVARLAVVVLFALGVVLAGLPVTTEAQSQDKPQATGQADKEQDKGVTQDTKTDSQDKAGTGEKKDATGAASPQTLTRPANKDQCKDGGWQSFSDPKFKNQGDCVSWVDQQEKANKGKK